VTPVDERALRLDGNAAAGVLADALGADVTLARGVCDGCGAVAHIGELVAYVHAPGIVLRCRQCESVMLRIVQSPAGYQIDLRGMRRLEMTR
jgi:Family of unknown function (DUF6510)